MNRVNELDLRLRVGMPSRSMKVVLKTIRRPMATKIRPNAEKVQSVKPDVAMS